MDGAQLGAHLLATGQPEHHELAAPRGAAAVGESQEVKRLRFALTPPASVLLRKAPELDQPRLLLVQRQPEVLQSLGHIALEALCVPAERFLAQAVTMGDSIDIQQTMTEAAMDTLDMKIRCDPSLKVQVICYVKHSY